MNDGGAAPFASTSVARHLARGAVGFTLIGAAFALAAGGTPLALALIVPGMVALRGCPTCWAVGLAQTISAGRLQRSCRADQSARFARRCRLQSSRSPSTTA
ncbi:MAG TPA: hypothetical protein VK790_07350 [Solirubrobacteraceae bacterium]|jgi:hypothetical protein|nr:hypothetical protein [Solirubrobacteraceae bacterium]